MTNAEQKHPLVISHSFIGHWHLFYRGFRFARPLDGERDGRGADGSSFFLGDGGAGVAFGDSFSLGICRVATAASATACASRRAWRAARRSLKSGSISLSTPLSLLDPGEAKRSAPSCCN